MSLLWLILLGVVLVTWMAGLTIFILTQLKRLREQYQAPHIFGLKYWSLVKYNPFGDTGGNQSFILCLLDEKKHGIILTSLHSREATRLYAKLITSGKTDTDLSEEEKKALQQAFIVKA